MNEIVITGLGKDAQRIAGISNSISPAFCAVEIDDCKTSFFITPKSLVSLLLDKRGVILIFKTVGDINIFEKELSLGPLTRFRDLKKAGVIVIQS